MLRRTIAAVAWLLVLLGACLVPGRWLHRDESQMLNLGILQADKLVHAFLFGVFGLLWMRAAVRPRWANRVFFAGVVLAVGTELGQGLPAIGRDPDPLDAAADLAGLCVGLAASRVVGGPAGRGEVDADADDGIV